MTGIRRGVQKFIMYGRGLCTCRYRMGNIRKPLFGRLLTSFSRFLPRPGPTETNASHMLHSLQTCNRKEVYYLTARIVRSDYLFHWHRLSILCVGCFWVTPGRADVSATS